MKTYSNTSTHKFRSSEYICKGMVWALLFGLYLSSAERMSAVDKGYFIGNWMNVDPQTRGLKAMQIGLQDNQMLMLAWGACHPNPCTWGQARVSLLAPGVSSSDVSAGTAVYKTSFAIRRLTIRPARHRTLEVEVMTHFIDNSGRSDYTNTERFRSVAWSEWDPNIFR